LCEIQIGCRTVQYNFKDNEIRNKEFSWRAFSTVRALDSRLGGLINEHTKVERRANSKGSLGILMEVAKGDEGLGGIWKPYKAGWSEAESITVLIRLKEASAACLMIRWPRYSQPLVRRWLE